MGALTLVTAATEDPITLDEVKEHLRIETNDFDAELTALIAEGTKYVEDFTGRKLVTQTWTYKIDEFSELINLPYPPLQSVSSISYQDDDNATQTLSSATYTVDTNSAPARIKEAYNQTYPTTYPEINSVTITFVAGYGDADDVPERFKRAIKMYCQWMHDLDSVAGEIMDRLITQDKVTWFALED